MVENLKCLLWSQDCEGRQCSGQICTTGFELNVLLVPPPPIPPAGAQAVLLYCCHALVFAVELLMLDRRGAYPDDGNPLGSIVTAAACE